MSEKVIEKKKLELVSIYPQIAQIKDAKLRQAVIAVWETLWDQSDWNDLADMPTSVEIQYPHLPHSQAVISLALAIADCYEKYHGLTINRDYLIAAAVLQDASKVVETRPGEGNGKIEKTRIGKHYPHAFWGAHVAVEKRVPEEVVHMMLYHTPKAAKFPDTLEGRILYYADQLDVMAIFKHRYHKELIITKEPEIRF